MQLELLPVKLETSRYAIPNDHVTKIVHSMDRCKLEILVQTPPVASYMPGTLCRVLTACMLLLGLLAFESAVPSSVAALSGTLLRASYAMSGQGAMRGTERGLWYEHAVWDVQY
eukprot:729279-Rhodomonas_salina.1